jgi:hypothetical protein
MVNHLLLSIDGQVKSANELLERLGSKDGLCVTFTDKPIRATISIGTKKLMEQGRIRATLHFGKPAEASTYLNGFNTALNNILMK